MLARQGARKGTIHAAIARGRRGPWLGATALSYLSAGSRHGNGQFMMQPIAREILARMVEIRRDLHRHPELSWCEQRTAQRVGEALDALGISYRKVGETGLVADLPGPDGVPRVALRADMDALPISEETGLPFASVHEGVMHACGHDGHTSMLLGAAELLVGEQLSAPVRLIFQPAEEVGSGARRMIERGALDGVALIFGGHIDPRYATGQLVITEGVVNASADGFRIRVVGHGAHAARPHEGIDAIVAGSYLVTEMQAIVSRELNPAQLGVISVGRFAAGSAANVIADRAELEGTVRAHDPAVRAELLASLRRVVDACAVLHRVRMELDIGEGTPPVRNDGDMISLAREAAVGVVGEAAICELADANMGGEDFGCYLERIPGCFIRFGARAPGATSVPAHSSRFTFDENVLGVGASWLYRVACVAGLALREGKSPKP